MSDTPYAGPEPLGLRNAGQLIGELSHDGSAVKRESQDEPDLGPETQTIEAGHDTGAGEDGDQPDTRAAAHEDEGDETEENVDGDTGPDADDEPRYEVTVNGETSEVTLTELRNGYQRQSDYTRKTQAVREREHLLAEQEQAVAGIRNRYTQNLEVVENFLESALPYSPAELEAMAETDPDAFQAADQENRQHLAKLEAVRGELEAARQHQDQAVKAAHWRAIEDGHRALPDLIPEWGDPKVAKEEAGHLTQYLRVYGVPDAEIAEIVSPLAISLARKAMLYDQSQAARHTAARKKVTTAPSKLTAPGSAKQPGHQKAKRQSELRTRLKKGAGGREERTRIAAQLIGNLK